MDVPDDDEMDEARWGAVARLYVDLMASATVLEDPEEGVILNPLLAEMTGHIDDGDASPLVFGAARVLIILQQMCIDDDWRNGMPVTATDVWGEVRSRLEDRSPDNDDASG